MNVRTIRLFSSPLAVSSNFLKSAVLPVPGPAITSFFRLVERRTRSTASASLVSTFEFMALALYHRPRTRQFVLAQVWLLSTSGRCFGEVERGLQRYSESTLRIDTDAGIPRY